eukprot:396443_1
MNQNTLFPISPYAQIPDTEKDAFIFYILQYCYKHSQPPYDQYIKDIIVPKCNGTIHIPSTMTPLLVENVHDIHWNDLKLFASNNALTHQSVTITPHVMVEYCKVALNRLNAGSNRLIPIQIIDTHNSYYDIEWVLIVHIVHKDCYVGVSFRYNEQSHTYVATAIYLDKNEIMSKNKLIGLKYNHCKQLKPFSLSNLSIIDEDHAVVNANHNNIKELQNEILQYQKRLFVKTANKLKLEQQLQTNISNVLQQKEMNTKLKNEYNKNICKLDDILYNNCRGPAAFGVDNEPKQIMQVVSTTINNDRMNYQLKILTDQIQKQSDQLFHINVQVYNLK